MTLRAAPPLDPDRDEARRLLQHELDTGAYQLQESIVSRVLRWLTDLLPDLRGLGPMPSWVTWAVLGLVLVAALAVIAFATRDRWRTARLEQPDRSGPVLDGGRLDAGHYRAAAQAALAAGDHGTALVEAYRAIAAGAIERTVLEDRPGSTAHEVAVALRAPFPDQRAELAAAADTFDAVRYGDRPAGRTEARTVLDLEERLRGATPVLGAAASGGATGFRVPR